MRPEIIISSIALGVFILSLWGWKWCIKIKIAALFGVIIGTLTAIVASLINLTMDDINIVLLLFLEAALIIGITCLSILVRFYRDPERIPKETENVILSPADGTVIYTNKVEKGSSLVSTKGSRKYRLDEIMSTDLVNDAAYLVGIDMNVLNVHVNRTPIAGKVELVKRTKGRFISLRKQESEVINERVTTIVNSGNFKVGIVQLASRLVRSIVSYPNEGDNLHIAQRIGAIVFGSQVDVAIPDRRNLRIVVKPGDEVKAGISVIARLT